ncbi:MAG: ACP phosphodiesterase [Azoarcus sp.]|jgi:acyl carrier protein phosphodiesterase|nr:ACP phosphodiesterase [Azoarcus sp.]MDX9836078.1 ACP phosphodiesterase [Azoarcus sp.]
MNFLAHLHLAQVSNTSPAGNLLGDFVKGPVPSDLAPALATGIRLHRRVDAFTDAHHEHRAAVRCFEPPWRRFGGVLVDMFYDHWLTLHWDGFNTQSLDAFLRENYAVLLAGELHHPALLPDGLPLPLRRMAEQDWLSTYRSVPGLRRALDGIGRRLRRPLELGASLDTLSEGQWAEMEAGFLRFYPDLIEFVRAEVVTIISCNARGDLS